MSLCLISSTINISAADYQKSEGELYISSLEGGDYIWIVRQALGVYAFNAYHVNDLVKIHVQRQNINFSGYAVNMSRSYWMNESWATIGNEMESGVFLIKRDWGTAAEKILETEFIPYWIKHPIVLYEYTTQFDPILKWYLFEQNYNWTNGPLSQILINNAINLYYWAIHDKTVAINEGLEPTDFDVAYIALFPTMINNSQLNAYINDLVITDIGRKYTPTNLDEQANYPFELKASGSLIDSALGLQNITQKYDLAQKIKNTTTWKARDLTTSIDWDDTELLSYINMTVSQWGQFILNYYNLQPNFWDWAYSKTNSLNRIKFVAMELLASDEYINVTFHNEWFKSRYITTVHINFKIDERNYCSIRYAREEGLLLDSNYNIYIINGSNYGNALTGTMRMELQDFSIELKPTIWNYVIWFAIIFGGIMIVIITISILVNRHQKKLNMLDY